MTLVEQATKMQTTFVREDIIPFLDHTRLTDNDEPEKVADFCRQVIDQPIAAVCIYPEYIAQTKKLFKTRDIKIATVVNFPKGTDPLEKVLTQISDALDSGADEIDVVMPYQDYLNDKRDEVITFIKACKSACQNKALLKVILETGVLKDPDIIANASEDMILAGADFLKTSTGKDHPGATLDAAAIMLTAIANTQDTHPNTGFKASAGIQDYATALQYLNLAVLILNHSWVQQRHFRFGSSKLLPDLI